MASAPPDNGFQHAVSFNALCDNGDSHSLSVNEDFAEDENESHRCQCIRRLSKHITSIGKVDELCEDEHASCASALSFLESVPVETRSAVARYLSTGKAGHLNLSATNFHNIYHMANILHLSQLRKICIDFCTSNPAYDIAKLFEECSLKEKFTSEMLLYRRTLSMTSDAEEKSPPEFYVVFSRNVKDTKKGGKEITNVIVINISEKMDVYNRETGQLGKATDCCSVYVDESPYIFVCGGEGKSHDMMMRYDVLLGQWNKCAKLLHGRSRHIVVADHNGSVFAIGGKEVACIEQFNIKTNKWKEVTALKTHVYNAVAACHRGRIYIFGGRTITGSVATTQCFNISTSRVTKLNELPCCFSDGQAVVYNDNIYIATRQGHMICYETLVDLSYLCSQQPFERDYFGMFVKGDRIFVVGGVPRQEDEGEVEPTDKHMYRYNPEADRWSHEKNIQKSFPVYSSCIIKYPKACSVIPFRDRN